VLLFALIESEERARFSAIAAYDLQVAEDTGKKVMEDCSQDCCGADFCIAGIYIRRLPGTGALPR
jgi:hypothetical protein